MKDHYQILRISKEATQVEIKKAYRKLAMEFHPDKNKSPNAHEKFVEIVTAYEVLINPVEKAKYDNLNRNDSFNEYKKQETRTADFNKEYKSQNAERYANMTYNEFENIINQIVTFGKEAKKTTKKGCNWIVAIVLFSFGLIVVINNLFFKQNGGIVIFIGLFCMLLGYGAYALAKEE